MKFKQFKTNSLKKKIFIISSVTIILLITSIILYRSFAFFEEKKDFNIIKGSIPDQNYDVMIVLTEEVNEIKKTINQIPRKESKIKYEVEIECDESEGYWDYENWNMVVNIKEKTKCKLNFKENANMVYPVKEDVEEGKKLIAEAITQKGINTNRNETLAQMAINIGKINTDIYYTQQYVGNKGYWNGLIPNNIYFISVCCTSTNTTLSEGTVINNSNWAINGDYYYNNAFVRSSANGTIRVNNLKDANGRLIRIQ